MTRSRKSHFVLLPREDGSVVMHPMKEWLRSNPEVVPDGLDPTASTSHQLRAALKKSGWTLQETESEFRLIAPGAKVESNTALREMLEETDSNEVAEAPDVDDASFGMESQLRDFLAQNLPAISIGGKRLRLYVDPTGRDGIEYPTAVGMIDILAVDESDNFFVLELKRGRTPDHTVGQIARYMGWVSQTIGRGRDVSGVVVAKKISEALRYSVCVFPRVSLFEYEVSFQLHPADRIGIS